MRKIIGIFLFIVFIHSAKAQNFSFSCPQDTILGCSVNCLDIVATFPDLRRYSDEYVVTNVTPTQRFCYPIVDPGAPGTSTSLIMDDIYSAIIPLPFSFVFYGVKYNSLVASTNGYVSFDIDQTGKDSHWENFGNLPNIGYDKALIMGPYQDMDPTIRTSPTQQIKYDVLGTAPNRKWVLTFYKVPLYSQNNECSNLINNTSQIILHETTNIIEITIADKEDCKTWLGGRSMIGIQNEKRNRGLMAPGRFESDLPWGNRGMNETWRFIPAAGEHLYKSVELLDYTGATIATGDTSRIDAGTFTYLFEKICVPPGDGKFYVVKTSYTDPANSLGIIYSLDSVFVTPNKIPVTAISSNTTCGANDGTITVSASGGTEPYSFSLDGGPGQPTGNFLNVSTGTHFITVTDFGGCIGKLTVILTTTSSLQGSYSKVNASCPGVNNGSINVIPSTGEAPFTFSANGGPSQLSGEFLNLSPGTYTIYFTDKNLCNGSVIVTITPGSNIGGTATSTPTSCFTSSDGTITANGNRGLAPYSYSLDGGIFQRSGFFNGVSPGNHIITVKDFIGCSINVTKVVAAGSTLVATTTTTSTSCLSVNNGTIKVIPSLPGNYTFTLLPANTVQVGNPLFTDLSPGTYSVNFSNDVGCSGFLNNIVVGSGTALNSSTTVTNPVCAQINDGTVTINPSSGVAPFRFSLSSNPVTQPSPLFTGLAAGSYTYFFTDDLGCSGTGSFTLITNPVLQATLQVATPLCNSSASGTVAISPAGGLAPYEYLLKPGTIYQASNTFTGLAAGLYTFTIKDFVGCTKDTTITIAEPSLLTASAVNTVAATCRGNDGIVIIEGIGGTLPYTYSLNEKDFQSDNKFDTAAPGMLNAIRVKDVNGCIASATVEVELLDTMRLTLGADTSVCIGSSLTLLPQTNDETNIFKWTTFPVVSLNTLSDPLIKNPVATPVVPVKYLLQATWGVCNRQEEIEVDILSKPVANAGNDTTVCPGEFATLRGIVSRNSGPVSYSWSPATYLNRTDSNVVIAALPVGSSTNFTLSIADNYGCNFIGTDDIRVRVRPRVAAFAGNDTIAVKGIPHQLFGSGGSQYTWSPTSPLNNANIENPLAILHADTRFSLVVRDVIGCIGYDTVLIKVYAGPTYYTPSAFTPNNDGINDVFRATPVGIVKTEFFRVFNRYGALMFETNKWLKGWDGNFRGRPQAAGTYVWIIRGMDRDGKIVEQKGTVVLIR